MLWFLEKESETLICEVRQSDDGRNFELAERTPGEPEHVERFEEPTRLIEHWLARQRELYNAGWRPKT